MYVRRLCTIHWPLWNFRQLNLNVGKNECSGCPKTPLTDDNMTKVVPKNVFVIELRFRHEKAVWAMGAALDIPLYAWNKDTVKTINRQRRTRLQKAGKVMTVFWNSCEIILVGQLQTGKNHYSSLLDKAEGRNSNKRSQLQKKCVTPRQF